MHKPKDGLVDRILDIYHNLLALPDLNPSEEVNRLFSSLVKLSLSESSSADGVIEKLSSSGISGILLEICAQGETRLEYHWAKKVAEDGYQLRDFPYYQNYLRLTDFEIQRMVAHTDLNGKRMFFVGSGALPLSPVSFRRLQSSLDIVCIDRDAEAVKYARGLLSKIGINYVTIESMDITDTNPHLQLQLSVADIVFMAALVGNSSAAKNQILKVIHPYLRDKSLIALRSVPDDLRRLLYPKFELEDSLKTKYKTLGEYSLPRETGVINSIAVMERV